MPRKIATQVVQTVSRLLEAGLIKQPPVWYDAVINHPPMTVPPRQLVARPDEDLPATLRSGSNKADLWLKKKASPSAHRRDSMNSKKKAKSLAPNLRPRPIAYEEDAVRQQFFRDHPWEAYRPTTLVEPHGELSAEPRAHGDPKRLRSYGRNPDVEDVVACTLAAHRYGQVSLAQAYHNTLSSFHGLKAEHEHATRYATLEARFYGADLGKSETQRGFEKEDNALETWAAWAAGLSEGEAAGASATTAPKPSGSRRSVYRVKRSDDSYTLGQSYLDAAKAFQEGKVGLDRLEQGKSVEAGLTRESVRSSIFDTTGSNDHMGIAKLLSASETSNKKISQSPSS